MLRFLFLTLCLLLPQAGLAGGFAKLFSEDESAKVLEPDQAFRLVIVVEDVTTLRARFTIAPKHYLYHDRISFSLVPQTGSHLVTVELPPGEAKQDPHFGKTLVLSRDSDAILRLRHDGTPPPQLTLQASYQGCSEAGLCYTPIRKSYTLDLGSAGNARDIVPSVSESDTARALLTNGKLWLIAVGFFGFGLLLAFTPCTLPMLPILSSIIVGQGRQPSRLHAFNLSLAYTLGMAVTYTLAGIAAAYSGQLISNTLQNPWALGIGAALFVLLALSMFGLYELRLPAGLETRLAELSNRFRGGRFIGVFAMGAVSALILSPCVAAPLAGALLYIGQSHDLMLGGVALFFLALGMGVPLLLLGASAGSLLPKAGPWMETISNVFGVILLGMAIWLIGPVIPPTLQLALWGALLVVCAVYLHALDGLPPHAGKGGRLWKGVGVITLVYGIALLAGALAGSRNPLQPLEALRSNSAVQAAPALSFQRVASVADLDAALKHASGKYVLLDFYADWCVSCKEYERFTFRDPEVVRLLSDMVLLQADVTDNRPEHAALLARFGLFGPPGIIFFDRAGREVPPKIIGYQNAERFLVSLNQVFASADATCGVELSC